MSKFLPEPQCGDDRERLPAARNFDGFRPGDGPRHGVRALVERRHLDDAERAVPEDRLRLAQAASAELISRGISDEGLTVGAIRPQVALNAVIDYLTRQFVASGRQLAEALLAASPSEPLYHAAMGAVLEAEGKARAAEGAYLEALVLDPAAPEPMMHTS